MSTTPSRHQLVEGTLRSGSGVLVTLPTALTQLGAFSEPQIPICEMKSKPCIFSCSLGRRDSPWKPLPPTLGPRFRDRVLDALSLVPNLREE